MNQTYLQNEVDTEDILRQDLKNNNGLMISIDLLRDIKKGILSPTDAMLFSFVKKTCELTSNDGKCCEIDNKLISKIMAFKGIRNTQRILHKLQSKGYIKLSVKVGKGLSTQRIIELVK